MPHLRFSEAHAVQLKGSNRYVTDRKAFSQLRQLPWAAGLSAALGLLVSCSSPGKQEADISASSLIQRVRDEGTG